MERYSIDHAPMAHDDIANAVAGVLVMAQGGSRIMSVASMNCVTQQLVRMGLMRKKVGVGFGLRA